MMIVEEVIPNGGIPRLSVSLVAYLIMNWCERRIQYGTIGIEWYVLRFDCTKATFYFVLLHEGPVGSILRPRTPSPLSPLAPGSSTVRSMVKCYYGVFNTNILLLALVLPPVLLLHTFIRNPALSDKLLPSHVGERQTKGLCRVWALPSYIQPRQFLCCAQLLRPAIRSDNMEVTGDTAG